MLRSVAFALSFLLSLALGCGGGTPGTGTGGNNGTTMREQATTNPHCFAIVDGQLTRPSCAGTVEVEARLQTIAFTVQVNDCAAINPRVLFNQTYRDFNVLTVDGGVTLHFNIEGVKSICTTTHLTYLNNSDVEVTWAGGVIGDDGYPGTPIALTHLLLISSTTKLPIEVARK